MAEDSSKSDSIRRDTGSTASGAPGGDGGIKRRLRFSAEKHVPAQQEPEPHTAPSLPTSQNVPGDVTPKSAETAGQSELRAVNTNLKTGNREEVRGDAAGDGLKGQDGVRHDDVTPSNSTPENAVEEDNSGHRRLQDASDTSKQQVAAEDSDCDVARRAQQEGCVNVVFSGTVTQEGCCRFVSEILKCILYQRQQLPMTYDQLVYSQKKQQASIEDNDAVSRRPGQSADPDRRKCQKTLLELEEVLQQLEVLFSLSKVPRVLLLMGGSLILPKELYEINLEALVLASGDQCLRVSSCLRQLFRTLFVADLLSDTRPVRLMPTTVLALAHRDCGVGWFRPKLQFKVPTRVKNQIIALSTDPSSCKEARPEESDWEDYVWFQAPMTIKGFSN